MTIPALTNLETFLESISQNKEFLTLTGILGIALVLIIREVYLHWHEKEESEKLNRAEVGERDTDGEPGR